MKTIFLSALLFVSFHSKAQKVEKSFFAVQAGFPGIWVYNESALTRTIALRTEIGVSVGPFGGYYYVDYRSLVLAPFINLEPRHYYNLSKRSQKGKDIKNNSANFIALKTCYHINSMIITDSKVEQTFVNQVLLVPKWGLRRNLRSNFEIEAGAGLGFIFLFGKEASDHPRKTLGTIDLNLRIGYRF